MSRKAEVIRFEGRARMRVASPVLLGARVESRAAPVAHDPRSERDAAWQLVHDDSFDRMTSPAELDDALHDLQIMSTTPYADACRRMVGLELDEAAARAFLTDALLHHAAMRRALDRAVTLRVAALDLMASGPRRELPRAIVVTPPLLERAFEEATADAVTGLPQRGQFLALLRHELRQRKRRRIAVAYLDLDGFKQVNDTQGHARGDDVLRALARAGRVVLRQGDVLARIGGDEFGIILMDVSEGEASAAVGRLRERFEERTAAYGTSFSAGVVVAEHGETADEALGRADALMFAEKRERAARR